MNLSPTHSLDAPWPRNEVEIVNLIPATLN